jgi:hypothetical protein
MGKTPNAYAGGATPGSVGTPGYYGYQTPSAYTPRPTVGLAQQPSAIPPGMNPDRHALIQKAGGWDQAGGW